MEKLEKQLKLELTSAIKRVSKRILPCAIASLIITTHLHLFQLRPKYNNFIKSVSESIDYLENKSKSFNPFSYIFK